MGLLYIIYRRDVSRRFVRGIYKGSVCIIWSTSKNYIGLRPEVCSSILGSLYSKTGNLNGDFDGILFINRWINGMIELDVRIVFMSLCQLCIE